mgnify:FL=1
MEYTYKDLDGLSFEEQIKIIEGVKKWVFTKN